jgi:hypothetical protein
LRTTVLTRTVLVEQITPHCSGARPTLRSRPNLLDRIALDSLTPEPMSVFREEWD